MKVRKIMGVTFDKTLEFDMHINKTIKTASSIFAMIRRSDESRRKAQ